MPVIIPPFVEQFFPNAYNFKPSVNLTKWRKAVANVKSGAVNGRIMCIGDSTTLGVGSTGSLTAGNFPPLCYAQRMADTFNGIGLNAHANSYMGMGADTFAAPSRNFNDSRIVMGSDWSYFNGTSPTTGGCYLASSADTSNPLTFTPPVPVSAFDIFTPGNMSAGLTVTASVNGGAGIVITMGGGGIVKKTTISCPLGMSTLSLKWSGSAGNVFVAGISGYDASKKWIDVLNAGWQGKDVANYAGAGPIGGMAGVAADLTLIYTGLNSIGSAVNATWRTNLQTVITQGLATGDCILVSMNPPQGNIANSLTYVAAMYDAAASNNIPLLDLNARFNTWAVSNALGFMFDALHPIALGYEDIGVYMANILGRI